MSELNGLFSMRTLKDMLAKFEHDLRRWRPLDAHKAEAHYAAFDCFMDALHMADWAVGERGGTLSKFRNYPQAKLVAQIGNGAKHFRVDRYTDQARDTRVSAGAFQSTAFGRGFQTARLVIDLEDGSTVDAMDLAERVLEHWRRAANQP